MLGILLYFRFEKRILADKNPEDREKTAFLEMDYGNSQ